MVCIFMGQGSPVSLLLFISMETNFPLSHISVFQLAKPYYQFPNDEIRDDSQSVG